MTSNERHLRALRIGAVGALVLAVGTSCRGAEAQQVTRDPLGPIRCFQRADDVELAEESAVSLCAGAINDAPGACYARGVDQFPTVATQKIQTLCTAATSLEPIECFTALDAQEVLTEDQMVAYCATTCPVSPPPPQAASAACLDLAIEETDLSLQHAGELCVGSSSAGPVQCYLTGEAENPELSETSLIQLCAERVGCQILYQPGAPTTAPGY